MAIADVLASFLDDCRAARESDDPRGRLTGLMKDLVADPAATAAAIPILDDQPIDTSPDGLELGRELRLYEDDELTILVLETFPGVVQPPHDHRMTAIIGVFDGIEDQRFFASGDDGPQSTPGKSLVAGDTVVLGPKSIHAISSPEGQMARAIHVYMGRIYGGTRTLFHPDTLKPEPFELDAYYRYCRRA